MDILICLTVDSSNGCLPLKVDYTSVDVTEIAILIHLTTDSCQPDTFGATENSGLSVIFIAAIHGVLCPKRNLVSYQ